VRSYYQLSVIVTSLVLAGLGVAIIVRTAIGGGGTFGFVIGPLFVMAGLGRFFLARSR
jgi:hypothetical protein